MTAGGAYKKFVGIAMGSGIREPERFHPHSTKHYAATRMLRKGMTEADVKKSVGWKPNSAMLGRYSHLTATDSRNAYLRASGLKVADAPHVEPFAVPTKDVPAIVAQPPAVVDLSDPRLMESLRKEIRAEADAIWLDEMRKARDKVADEKNFEVRTLTPEELKKLVEQGGTVQVFTQKKS